MKEEKNICKSPANPNLIQALLTSFFKATNNRGKFITSHSIEYLDQNYIYMIETKTLFTFLLSVTEHQIFLIYFQRK